MLFRSCGYVCSPEAARGNRSHQFFFVNGRFVKSALLQAALEQAYKSRLFSGRFPSCVLYVSLNPAAVDVNVHPAKTEIKFLNERQVFDTVHYAVKAALDGERMVPRVRIAPSSPEPPATMPEAKQAAREEIMEARAPKDEPAPPRTVRYEEKETPYNAGVAFKTSIRPPESREPLQPETFEQIKILYGAGKAEAGESVEVEPPEPKPEQKPAPESAAGQVLKSAPVQAPDETPYRIIGEAMGAYIIVERGDSLFLIDKHAAHERMLFNRLKASDSSVMTQTLLTPHIAWVGREEAAELLAGRELLCEMGFEIEDYGGGALAVNSAPEGIEVSDITALLTEICEDLRLGKRQGGLAVRDEILASIACKAAVKAGKLSQPEEYLPLVSAVMSGEIKYCPHGRPVSVELTKPSLDKSFKRT